MCLSPETDLAAGLAIGVVGIDAVRHVTRPTQWPMAALPLLFATHQLTESAVWWGLDGTLPATVGRVATWAYLAVAFVLPVLMPVAAARLEPDVRRRSAMWACTGLGTAVSGALLWALWSEGPHVQERAMYLDYRITTPAGRLLAVLYVVTTCGAFLVSSDRRVALIGAGNLVAVIVLGSLLLNGVISLWCVWAAAISVLIAADLRATAQQWRDPAPTPAR